MGRIHRKATMLAGIAALLLGSSRPAIGAAIPEANPGKADQLSRATAAVETLQAWYDRSTGIYKTTGWWNSANAITALVDYARLRKTTQYNELFANTFTAAQKQNAHFLNEFYDDEGWWALAWIDAYDLTGKREYLAMAKAIFADMAGGWDSTCGGGIWWSKSRKYKNAIANELFLSVAAHLADRDSAGQGGYLDWANKEWSWFDHSGMINAENLVNDGLRTSGGQSAATTCTNNGQTTWSYNQGVVLGGLAELSRLNHDATLPQAAEEIAKAAVTKLVDANGVMHDPCEPKCGADGVQFKGIFVRNLEALNQRYPHPAYASFLTTNANSIWDHAQGPDHQLGQVWSGPFVAGDAGSQSSALDVIVAAATLDSRE